MKLMPKRAIWIVVLVISCALFYFVGTYNGRRIAMDHVSIATQNANAEVALGEYTIYRDIVANIKAGKTDTAICSAALEASSSFDEIKSCLANEQCKHSILKKTREVAPEVLDGTSLKFDYIKLENGFRRCGDNASKANPAR